MKADGWRKALVLLRIPRLPHFVEYEPDATRALRDIALAKLKDFSAKMVGGVAEQRTMGGLGETILDVLRKVLLVERAVQRWKGRGNAIRDAERYVVDKRTMNVLHGKSPARK